MNRLEKLRSDVQTQLEDLTTVVDEFEHTVEDVEQTLAESKFSDVDSVSGANRQSLAHGD